MSWTSSPLRILCWLQTYWRELISFWKCSRESWAELNLHINDIELNFTILPNNTIKTIHFGNIQHSCCQFAGKTVMFFSIFYLFVVSLNGCQGTLAHNQSTVGHTHVVVHCVAMLVKLTHAHSPMWFESVWIRSKLHGGKQMRKELLQSWHWIL